MKRKVVIFGTVLLVVLGQMVFAGVNSAPSSQNQQSGAESQTIRKIGAIAAIDGNSLTLKTDGGESLKVTIQEDARMVRIAPGEKDLKNAVPLTLKELQVGDRILINGKSSDSGSVLASSVVAIKQMDLAQKQAREREDWQKHSVGGIVKAIDPSTGAITIAITPISNVTVKTGKNTGFLRYAPDSIRFSDARPADFADIKVGDQLRARGTRSPDGLQVVAEQIVSGSFRNIAGTIVAVDAPNNTLTVKDVLSKKTVLVKVTPDSQLHNLPPPLAQRVAAMLRGPAPGATPPGGAKDAGAKTAQAPAPLAGQKDAGAKGDKAPAAQPDLQQILSKAPTTTLAELQKNSAVLIVSTSGDAVTAINLLGGAEPILTAAPDGRAAAALLSGWSLAAALADPVSQ